MKKRRPKRQRAPSPLPDINVTPLVDIVLVLLIIFMVVTPAIAQGETIDTPEAAQIDKAPKDLNPIDLVVAANGRILLEERQVSMAELEERLAKYHARDPNQQIKANIDSKIAYKTVRELLATFQKLGFKGVSLKVLPVKGPGG